MIRAAVIALAFGSATAFVPSKAPSARNVAVFETKADLEKLAMELNPVVGFYDPLNLAEANFWNEGNEATIGFLRHAEIKHGRVAMAAFVGFTLAANGVHFPWAPIGGGGTYDSTNPGELWDSLPLNAKLQIVGFIGLLEWWSELGERVGQPAHYMRGGKPGYFPPFKGPEVSIAPHVMPLGSLYDPFGFSKNKSEEAKARGRLGEINNGRLAMIGIMGFVSAAAVPGSVPGLGFIAPYSGEFMAPF